MTRRNEDFSFTDTYEMEPYRHRLTKQTDEFYKHRSKAKTETLP